LAQRRRLDIKPGLTCFWQIEGRGDIPFSKQADLDIQYVDSQSIFLDILLILKTVPAVLLGKGAY
jgi:lipopolysaccharide/colanic/teichoic acid biosynthesis glycosyltransferase